MTFGKQLQVKRKEKRFSQRKLASEVGVDFTYISKIENGVLPPPSEETILKMAEVLEADGVSWLLSAGKIPTTFQNLIFSEPNVVSFLREASTIPKGKWEVILKMVKEGQKEVI